MRLRNNLPFWANFGPNRTFSFNVSGLQKKAADKAGSKEAKAADTPLPPIQADKSQQAIALYNSKKMRNAMRYLTAHRNERDMEYNINQHKQFYAEDALASRHRKDDQALINDAAYRAFMYGNSYKDHSNEPAFDPSKDSFTLIGFGADVTVAAAEAHYGNPGEIFDERIIRDELNAAISSTALIGAEKALQGTSAYNFDQQVENLSAYYAFYQSKAAQYYQGDEYTKIMETVSAQFSYALTKVTDNFMNDDRYSRYMQSDREGVKESVSALFQERSEAYVEMYKSEGFQAEMDNVSVSWAKESAYYVSAKLRGYAEATQNEPASSAAKYTYSDIKAMITMSFESQLHYQSSENAGGYGSEEALGVSLGMDAIMMQMFAEKGNMSQNGIAAMRESYGEEKSSRIKMLNDYLKWQSRDPYSPKGYRYDPVDEKAVDRVISRMRDALKGNSLEEGIRSAINDIGQMYKDKQARQYQSGEVQERYKTHPADSNLSFFDAMLNSRSSDSTSIINLNSLAQLFNVSSWQVSGNLYKSFDFGI